MWHFSDHADKSGTPSSCWQLHGDTERFKISFWGLQARQHNQTGIFPIRSNWLRQMIAFLPSHNNKHKVLHPDLFLFETTGQYKEVQLVFKLPDHNPHRRPRLLVNRGLLLLLPGEPYWELVSGRWSPWKRYMIGARYFCVGYLTWLITYLVA